MSVLFKMDCLDLLDKYIFLMLKGQQTIDNIWGWLLIFPKILSYQRQHVTTEKDHQSHRGLIYQYHLFFQQTLFLLE